MSSFSFFIVFLAGGHMLNLLSRTVEIHSNKLLQIVWCLMILFVMGCFCVFVI